MKIKKIIWIILLIVGIIPFIIPLVWGINVFINGFKGFCSYDCVYDYGFSALKDVILIYSWLTWPTYVIGAILIVLSIIKLKSNRKK